jgi:outer membrane protein OmpA-like peptidoglycan-associated protein
MRRISASFLSVALLAMAGCDINTDTIDTDDEVGTEAEEPATDPLGTEADADTDTAPTTSILRPDIEPITPPPADPIVPLEPLIVVVGFPEGGAELDDAARATLGEVLASDQIDEGGQIILRGHSDSGGSDAANMRASRNRAQSVRDFLVENDVEPDRIEVIAFGEQNPVRPNANPDGSPNESGRARNRRVQIPVEVEDETDDPPERQADSRTAE